MAYTNEQLSKAITAVKNGVATKEQQEKVAEATKRSDSTGNRAREAFDSK